MTVLWFVLFTGAVLLITRPRRPVDPWDQLARSDRKKARR